MQACFDDHSVVETSQNIMASYATSSSDVGARCPAQVLHFSHSNHFQECSFMPSNCLWAIQFTSNKPNLARQLAQDKRKWMRRLPRVYLQLVERFWIKLYCNTVYPRGKELDKEQTEVLNLLPTAMTHAQLLLLFNINIPISSGAAYIKENGHLSFGTSNGRQITETLESYSSTICNKCH